MPLTGTETTLTASLQASIEAEIASLCGSAPVDPNCIEGLASGIAKAIIPHLVSNIQVNAGQAVVIPVTSVPPAPSAGAVTTPGSIT